MALRKKGGLKGKGSKSLPASATVDSSGNIGGIESITLNKGGKLVPMGLLIAVKMNIIQI